MAVRSAYEERAAPGALGAWAPCLWVRRVPEEGAAESRVVPDGCVDLIWMRGRLEVAGPDSAHRRVRLEAGERIAGVRLRPGAAPLLLGETPAAAVLDAQPGLDRLWGDEARRLAGRLAAEPEPWRVAETLAGALSARLGRYGPDRVAVAVAEALDRPRLPSVAGMAWELGFSERQLRRRVVSAVGYGPKTLEQVLRFRRAMAASGPEVDWARVAAEAGYADQAHLSRQVRRWSGATPRALAAQAA
ncbi:helix-turn-helix domain-containing protein [Glycomyces tenuis]|uniref:helix-turn-helix domain-containing protein n=1 Tax=Glycomyces tenuis TaxID=58116 RepID=UPI000416B9D6|nr:helix-turn-helix domain-containing protein [Glycomyces tenuis]